MGIIPTALHAYALVVICLSSLHHWLLLTFFWLLNALDLHVSYRAELNMNTYQSILAVPPAQIPLGCHQKSCHSIQGPLATHASSVCHLLMYTKLVMGWLWPGLKFEALAWLKVALTYRKHRPSQARTARWPLA
jgi:hypothetical protein